MKKIARSFALIAAMAVAAVSAQAQYKIAAGNPDAGSTYAEMQAQIVKFCPGMGVEMVVTNGTLDNFNLLAGNEVNGGWVQADALFDAKSNDPDRVANLKTVVGLHREALHFVARNTVESGGLNLGVVRLGGETKVMRDLSDARGMKIGAVGGSYETARIVNDATRLDMKLVRFKDNNSLVGALEKGEINVALFVGGINYKPVQALSKKFRLLSVPDDIIKAARDVYTTMNVSYRNLEQSGVKTLNTQALLVTQNHGSAKMKAIIMKIRDCFNEHAEEIADSTGTNPAWRDVKPGQNGNWPLYGQ